MQIIQKHFRQHLQRGPWDFCWRIGVESTVVSILVGTLLLVFGAPEREFPDWTIGGIFVVIVLLAPPLESLLMQGLPIFIARKLKASFRKQVITATVVFSLCHLAEGFGALISAGIVGGFYFSFTYAHWRSKSRWQAFWVTSGSHAIHNAIAFILILIFGI